METWFQYNFDYGSFTYGAKDKNTQKYSIISEHIFFFYGNSINLTFNLYSIPFSLILYVYINVYSIVIQNIIVILPRRDHFFFHSVLLWIYIMYPLPTQIERVQRCFWNWMTFYSARAQLYQLCRVDLINRRIKTILFLHRRWLLYSKKRTFFFFTPLVNTITYIQSKANVIFVCRIPTYASGKQTRNRNNNCKILRDKPPPPKRTKKKL